MDALWSVGRRLMVSYLVLMVEGMGRLFVRACVRQGGANT